MNLQEMQKLLYLIQIGQAIQDKTVCPRLEAFFGNAIYYRRGMPTMNKYKTVKEVCALTGLTRKHLYYFHHEGVVRAVAYANYSVEGHDGYKLYDDNAVEKLQQISLYYQLGLKRDEIKAIMQAPNYDSNAVIQTLLTLEREKKLHIERSIAALEYLLLVGTKNGVSGSLCGVSLDDFGRVLLDIRQRAKGKGTPNFALRGSTVQFAKEFTALIADFAKIDEAQLQSSARETEIQKIFELSNVYLGADSTAFLLGVFMSVLGEGTAAKEMPEQLTPAHGRAVIRYMIEHPQLFHYNSHTQSSEKNNIGRNRK